MRLSYNGYNHSDNEVWFSITKQAVYGPRRRREREVQTWDIRGVLIADENASDQEANLTAKIGALETAYSTNGGDLIFTGNTSGNTRHTLLSSNTINGIQVVGIDWLPGNQGIWGSGTEYVNKRSYRIRLRAETLWSDDELYFYRSTFSYTGTTGNKKIWMPSLTGVPQQQIVQAATTQKIVQTGMNIGMTNWLPIDAPLLGPIYEHLDRRQYSRDFPLEQNINLPLKYPTRWTYYFETPFAVN